MHIQVGVGADLSRRGLMTVREGRMAMNISLLAELK
jgi:hypothetical protein